MSLKVTEGPGCGNGAGTRPLGSEVCGENKGVATFVSVLTLPTAIIWRFSQLPVVPSGVLVFGVFFKGPKCILYALFKRIYGLKHSVGHLYNFVVAQNKIR